MKHALACAAGLAAALLSTVPLSAAAQTASAGWQAKPALADGRLVFMPAAPAAGEDTAVTYYPPARLDPQPVERWLADTLSRDAPPAGGSWQGAPKVEAQTANIANAQRAYRDAGGASGFAIYLAFSIDQSTVRLARWTANSSAAAQRHGEGAKALMTQLATIEKAAAASEQRAVRVDAQPPGVKGLRAGGALVAGKYEGDVMSGNKFIRHITLLMHANGEYEYLQGGSSITPHGKYDYQPGTGRLDVSSGLLYNSTYHPDEDFCVYGRDASGAPVIYAEDHYGVGTFTVWLRRVSDVDRPPHSAAEVAKQAAEAEAARYKFVTAPGKGLQASEIETIVYRWEQVYTIGGMQMNESAYLLLKVGTVHDGLPVAPADMDVPQSRRHEPQTWGRWRRSGSTYAFAWADKPSEFRPVQQGFALLPGAKGTKLAGQWSSSSSYSIPGGGSSWSTWGVRLRADGRFETFRSGGAGAGNAGSGVVVGAVYDDEGTAASGSGPNFAVGSERKHANRGDRSGSYEVDGYNITLRFDNGSVLRQAFALDGKRESLWFQGSLMSSR